MNKLLSRGALSALVTAILATPVMAEPLPEDAAVQLLRKLDDLQTDVSKLRGENEKLRHDLDKLKKNQRDNFQQMDERMDKLKDQAATKSADSSGSSTTTNSGTSSSSSTSNTTTTANTNAGISSSSTSSNPTTTTLTNSENKPSDSTTKVADIKPSTPPTSNDTKDSGKKDDPNGFYSYGTGKTDDPNPAKPKDEKTDSAKKPDETKPSDTEAKPADSGSSVTNKSERSAYEDAFNTLLKSPKEAVPAFRSFLKTYPNSALAASAQYWIGEALYAEKDFKGAVEEFLVVLKEYKGSDKAPDAALKLGYSFYELKDWEKARKTLEDVISFFPNSKENAAKAKDRLDKMTAEGH